MFMGNLELNFYKMINDLIKIEFQNSTSTNRLTNLDFVVVESNVYGLSGPVAIQIGYFNIINEQLFNFKLEKLLLRKINYISRELDNNNIIKNAILVTNLDNTYIEDFKKNNVISGNIIIWGSYELNARIVQFPEISARYNDQFFAKVITEEFSKFILGPDSRSEQIRYNTNKYLNCLRKDLSDGELVLFLGAGVSMSANMLGWADLVSKVYFEALNSKGIKIKDIRRDPKSYWKLAESFGNGNLLIRTRYAKLLLEENFNNIVHRWLYKDSTDTSDLIKQISNIIALRDEYDRRLVNSVVTYNYDNLIEENLKLLDVPVTPIWRESQRVLPSSVGIYHVHGYLPKDNEYSGNIVFSEDEYHELYKNPYTWSNVIQLNLFRERTCLFIGSTLSDPNIRRLLDVSKQSNFSKQHYIIYPRIYTEEKYRGIINDAQQLSIIRKNNNENVINKLNYLLMDEEVIRETMLAEELLIEKDFSNLGLNVIWISDFSEIPKILETIR